MYLPAFLFPQSLYFCVHGMLAHHLIHPLALSRGTWRGTHDVLVLSKKRGRRLNGTVACATAAPRLAAVRSTRNRPRVGYHADDGSS